MSTQASIHAQNEAKIFQYLKTACGPLIAGYLDDPDVTEIMANPAGDVWIEKKGSMTKVSDFISVDDRRRVINLVAGSKNVVINEDNPSIGAVMPRYHARFQGSIPPIVDAPAYVIRKHSAKVFPLENYVKTGTLTKERAEFIKKSILDRKNILVIGGTGTGKTTFSNALLQIIAETDHRVLTIEDTPELQCEAPNKYPVYTSSTYSWAAALKDALRLRPDRIIVGEIRDGESALNLLSAWNTGHSGGVATIHANSAAMGIRRMETMLATVSKSVPYELLGDAIDLLVHIKRVKNGRLIDTVLSVEGYDLHSKEYKLTPI